MKPPLRVTVTTEVPLAPPAVIGSGVRIEGEGSALRRTAGNRGVHGNGRIGDAGAGAMNDERIRPIHGARRRRDGEVDVAPVTLMGFIVAVTPAGAPVTVRPTAPAKGAVRVTVMTDVTAPRRRSPSSVRIGRQRDRAVLRRTTTTVSVAVAVVTPVPAALMVMVLSPGVTAAPTEISTVAVGRGSRNHVRSEM